MLVIHRAGMPNLERAVRITQDRKTWYVNPSVQVRVATGESCGRMGCIVSFASGLKASGREVIISDNRTGFRPSVTKHVKNLYPDILVYWICGYAWGRNRWDMLVHALEANVQPHKRKLVLEATAEHYYANPYQMKLNLIVPLT